MIHSMLFTTRFRHAVRCVLLLFPLICAICTAQAQSSQNKVELTPEFLAKMQKYTEKKINRKEKVQKKQKYHTRKSE